MNVLLTSAGRRVAVLRAFQRESRLVSADGWVMAADASDRSAAYHAADEGVIVPRCDAPDYVPRLLEIVKARKIGVLVPLIDTELPILSRHRREFLDLGCYPAISDSRAVDISRDKARTVEVFGQLGFCTPRVVPAADLRDPDSLPYPLFLKPAAGSSSIGAVRINDADELRFYLPRTAAPVVQALEDGDEFTVDVFVDDRGQARCAVPRRRWETRGGEISKGCTVRDAEIMEESMALVGAVGGCRGCVTLQCFKKRGKRPVFFEANLRFGGGFPLTDAAGANYVGWTLKLARGEQVDEFDSWQEGLAMLRYDDAIFVPGGRVA